MHTFIINIALFAIIASSPVLCNEFGETDPIVVTCRKTTDFGFCVNTLRSDPKSAKASVYEMAEIAVGKLGDHTKETSSYLQELLKGSPVGKKMVVGACINSYTSATNTDVPAAVKSLNDKAYEVAKKAASATMMDGERCQTVLNKNPSPSWQMLNRRNEYTHDLSQLSCDLIGLIS